jgi:trigger factor
LIVETLIEDLKLEVEEEELEKEFERIAAESNADLEDIKKYYGDEDAKEYLKEEIKEQKFYDIIFERNTIKTGEKTKLKDFEANYGQII